MIFVTHLKMNFYKNEDLLSELINLTLREGDTEEISAKNIEEVMESIAADYSNNPSNFPIDILMDQMTPAGDFPQLILQTEVVFNNVIHWILNAPDTIDLTLDPPENYKKSKQIPEFQDYNLCFALYYIDYVIKQQKEAIASIPDQLIHFLIKMIYCSSGKSCQWALHLLTCISAEELDKLEEYQYISRVGEVFKFCLDEDIRCFALQALEPFFAFSEDYKRKRKIFDFIHSKFSLMTPKLKKSALSLFQEYIQSSERDSKYAARNNLLHDCISLINPGSDPLLTKQAIFIVYYFVNNGPNEFLQDSVTYERLIQQIGTVIMSDYSEIVIPAYILLDSIVEKATPELPLFHNFMIPKKTCNTIINRSNEEKKYAIDVLTKFILKSDETLMRNIIQEDVIIPCLDIFPLLKEETQIAFLQGLLHMFSFDLSVWESLDPDELIEQLNEFLHLSPEVAEIAQLLIDKINQLLE